MAESAFEKLASAEAEAEKIRQTGAENQREQLKRAKADGDEIIASAHKNAEKGLETLEKKLAERDGESREDIERNKNQMLLGPHQGRGTPQGGSGFYFQRSNKQWQLEK